MISRLALTHITKRYPAVVANDDVSLTVLAGEIHAVLGENGAGKSTLMKTIYGAVRPDSGEIKWNGKTVSIANPQAARALGIAMVFQHFSLFETLTVAENVWLGLAKKTKLAEVTESIRATAEKYGLELEPTRPVHTLSVGERQRVEIVRALLSQPSLLILDEPTSVLTPQAIEKLFITLRKIASEGCSILYVSHKLDEIRALCSTCTIMRAGKVTGVCDPRQETNQSLSAMMLGQPAPRLQRHQAQVGEVALQAHNLSHNKSHPFGTALRHIQLEVRRGEIVGIAGISGNGQSELFAALSGEDGRVEKSAIEFFAQAMGNANVAARRNIGLACVPEERIGRGAVPQLSLAQNMWLTEQTAPLIKRGWVQSQAAHSAAQKIIQRFGVKASGAQAAAKSLSGGNLQKFILGRAVMPQPKILIVAQPTWGVDVGASAQIRAEIVALRDAGCAVLLISEDLDELLEMSDRLYVIAKGELSPSLPIEAATIEKIGQWMSGLWPRISEVAA
jgi:ABC-type uncharacterized transport system ATPase subunit